MKSPTSLNPLNTIDLVVFMPYPRRMRSPARRRPTPEAWAGTSSWRPSRVDPREVASRLAPAVHWPGALDRQRRTWRLVARTPDFEAWLVAVPSGGHLRLS